MEVAVLKKLQGKDSFVITWAVLMLFFRYHRFELEIRCLKKKSKPAQNVVL